MAVHVNNFYIRMKTVYLLLAITCPLLAQARLGETPEQIQKRYGSPSKKVLDPICGLTTSNYLFKEYSIDVSFKDGLAVREAVKKAGRAMDLISMEEGAALVKAIGGEAWKASEGGWKSRDGGRAMWFGQHVFIESGAFLKHKKAYEQQESKRKAEADRKKADGF